MSVHSTYFFKCISSFIILVFLLQWSKHIVFDIFKFWLQKYHGFYKKQYNYKYHTQCSKIRKKVQFGRRYLCSNILWFTDPNIFIEAKFKTLLTTYSPESFWALLSVFWQCRYLTVLICTPKWKVDFRNVIRMES